jgi:demethylmenaquinone methyltransferase/2-methoxy-6-polyprenyl-1,4-benzoquinol methylase
MHSNDPARRFYQAIAPVYDRVSGERILYARARRRAIELLGVRPRDIVLDVACGTGRNHELIMDKIGPSGRLIGVDRSPAMLNQARERVRRYGWSNVELIQCDVTDLDSDLLAKAGVTAPEEGFDAALCTLGLTVIPDWKKAWTSMLAMVRPGGGIAVMDAGYPPRPGDAGEVVALRPIAWLMCWMFAADPRRQPWQLVLKDTERPFRESYTFGYIGVAVGLASTGDPLRHKAPAGHNAPEEPA